ncbi:hypothetical protein EJ05DRAFT_137196 [Pseudovirgaria hyperparasitica]|uniref:Heterokaryon incompatibility domain-containing protein n=1 Tax=Pseudovirgaria hyperparasitica TaxID=470096 RepID=A0A6A6W1G4_9PEZI|nr:uncharacterized protein EJ05DRAFT_137196 [Pseudovirgaria hyperparasitica]KAF2754891.1 hypothetical protein EJ05DRAFT_137196 [Pseudovirgaria hyperparasitica]
MAAQPTMLRWHERGCKHPEVSAEIGVPVCRYCFAMAPQDTIRIGQTANRQPRRNLRWPPAVVYTTGPEASETSNDMPSPQITTEPSENQSGLRPLLRSQSDIRLFRVKPGSPHDLIYGDMELVDLGSSDIPAYDTVSYTSADDSGEQSSSSAAIYVGKYWDIAYVAQACEHALRRVRSRRTSRLFWVDALCLGFESTKEKDHHIFQMHSIHGKASKAIAYIGEASADSAEALAFMGREGSEPEQISESTRKALESLFARPFFSRLWILLEMVFATDINILCGPDAIMCPMLSLATRLANTNAPTWISQRPVWRDTLSHAPLMEILTLTSGYRCLDPRDKVFSLLAFRVNDEIASDYSLAVEEVYTGLAAYLIQIQHAFDILVFSSSHSTQHSVPNWLPSWVPDWSQKLVTTLPTQTDLEHEDFDMEHAETETATPVSFKGPFRTDISDAVRIDSSTGSLQVYAFRLCKLAGRKVFANGQAKIIMERGQRGSLVVTVKDTAYEPSSDWVFLLHGWEQPVVLRAQKGLESFTFVSTCILAVGRTSGSCFISSNQGLYDMDDRIEAAQFSPEDCASFEQFHDGLTELHRIRAMNSATSEEKILRVLDYKLLSLTGTWAIESSMMNKWTQLEQQLGWMFLDQAALGNFIESLDHRDAHQYQGSGPMLVEPNEMVGFSRYCGAELRQSVSWDIRRFCSTFLRRPEETAAAPDSWSPLFSRLQSSLPQIQDWASLTEQLLGLLELSSMVLSRSWPFPPGGELSARWQNSWADGTGSTEDITSSTCTWDWSEFKTTMALRARLWEQSFPEQLDPSINHTMAVQLGCRAIELNIVSGKYITIA